MIPPNFIFDAPPTMRPRRSKPLVILAGAVGIAAVAMLGYGAGLRDGHVRQQSYDIDAIARIIDADAEAVRLMVEDAE